MNLTQKPTGRAQCPHCLGWWMLRSDGTLRRHRNEDGVDCSGTYGPPRPAIGGEA